MRHTDFYSYLSAVREVDRLTKIHSGDPIDKKISERLDQLMDAIDRYENETGIYGQHME
jgi:hypothetical protein